MSKRIAMTVSEHLPAVISEQDKGRMRLLGMEMARIYGEKLKLYRQLHEGYPNDEGIQELYGTAEGRDKAARAPAQEWRYQEIIDQRAESLDWDDLQRIFEHNPDDVLKVWDGVLAVAEEKISSGLFAREALGVVDSKLFDAAQFVVLRDQFIKAWVPKDAIENSMVDMLVESFFSYHYWLRRANSMGEAEYDAAEQPKKKNRYGELEKGWNPPRVSVADAIDRAVAMADRFNRLFLRTLRQMRDLRRYALPVIVNNGGQVNVAADGGQQQNVQAKGKKKAKGGAGVPGSRRLKAV